MPIIIVKKKRLITKKKTELPFSWGKVPASHFEWPNRPSETETVLEFISLCREKEIWRGWRAARDIIHQRHERYSGEKLPKGGDERETFLRKARVVYWLQRCEYERTEKELSTQFWSNYDAAFADRLDRMDPIFTDTFNLMKEESNMAKKFVTPKVESSEEETTPKKKIMFSKKTESSPSTTTSSKLTPKMKNEKPAKTPGEPSTKLKVYMKWASLKKPTVEQMITFAGGKVKDQTIKGWMGMWSKGKGLPAGVEPK